MSSKSGMPGMARKGFYLRSMLQMAPLEMPGVVLGQNKFIYSDNSSGATKVRIAQVWDECDANVPIPVAAVAVNPANGSTSSGRKCASSGNQDLRWLRRIMNSI